jgi:hypothetical protein
MSTKLKTCFNGCSFTVGEGFPIEQRSQYIYDRVLAKKYNFQNTNIATPGASNYKIFMKSCNAILSGNYDIVFIQWSAVHRIWFYPGPDCSFFTNNKNKSLDFEYKDIRLSSKEKIKFLETLTMLNHDYQNIIDLIDYCNILTNLESNVSTKIIFINGLLPWTADLAMPLSSDLSSSLSPYFKSMLDFDTRPDSEIIKFFSELQNKFTELDLSKWVNVFDSFYKNTIDDGPEGHHPGIQSHQWMADQISTYLENNNIL